MSWSKTARGTATGVKDSLASNVGGNCHPVAQSMIAEAIDAFPAYKPPAHAPGTARMFEVETNGHIPDSPNDATGTVNIKITAHQISVGVDPAKS